MITQPSTSQAINKDTLKKALPKLETALTTFDKGVRIYRGLRRTESKYRYKPQMHFGQRVSANTDNYYTLIVDHDPAWSDYPPRSASIICTNRLHVAGGYGTSYVVLAEGDPLVGICPKVDYWISFTRLEQVLGKHSGLDNLNLIIKRLVKELAHIPKYTPASYTHLTNMLEIVDEQITSQNINWTDWHMQQPAKLIQNTPPGALLEKLQWILNPVANGFRTSHLSEIVDFPRNHELWMRASIYMIGTHVLPDGWSTNADFNLKTWIEQQ